jgi:2-hydroxychromene-2-carboxylate isomerase
MALHIDYYFAAQSPWAYLGHARFAAMAHAAGATVRVLPVDFGKVFAVSGGLPLPQRAAQRQAYRLVELQRFSRWLGLPLNLHPKHFPVAGAAASKLILTVAEQHGSDAAMRLTGRVQAGVWADQLDIADAATLQDMLRHCELPASCNDDAQSAEATARYDAATQRAIDAGVFGAPSYVIDGEIFWGQDRLDFVQRRLAAQ